MLAAKCFPCHRKRQKRERRKSAEAVDLDKWVGLPLALSPGWGGHSVEAIQTGG